MPIFINLKFILSLLSQTQQLCRLYDIKPARSKGQNFLINEEIYNDMIAAANLQPTDTVLEVGPGLGFLTAKLAKAVKKVIAVELDDKLAEFLRIGLEVRKVKNVEVVNQSINHYQLTINNYYKVVANLPYNITSIFLRRFLERENKPSEMILMLQREVAERIAAKPPNMSLLAIAVQFYAQPEIVQIVDRNNFWPKPEVDSAIIKLNTKNRVPSILERQKPKINEKDFFRLVKFGFIARRKMLKNNLAGGFHVTVSEAEEKIQQAGFNPKIRAQELGAEEWIKLFEVFRRSML